MRTLSQCCMCRFQVPCIFSIMSPPSYFKVSITVDSDTGSFCITTYTKSKDKIILAPNFLITDTVYFDTQLAF